MRLFAERRLNAATVRADRRVPEIAHLLQLPEQRNERRQRAPGLEGIRFALRADSDIAQLMAIRSGFGVGLCQVALARRDPDLQRVLPEFFDLKLGVWLAMHENLRATARCRAVFDGQAAGLKAHVD
jgi:hypothetical protein